MKHKTIWFFGYLLVLASFVRAEDPTSKFVSLAPLSSSLSPSSSGVAVQFEVWDQATAGTMIFSEAHTVDTDATAKITNDTGFADLLLGRPTGLNPDNFQAGSSRYLDVTVGGVSQLSARIPLYATPFSLNPGPQGPPGPTGPQGQQGPPGVVQTVTNADTSISVTGTPQDRTVAVANGGITDAHLAGGINPAKITGIAATLGPNNFSGDQSITGSIGFTGNLSMANSTPTSGNILKGGSLFLHSVGTNTFLGLNAGNLGMTGDGNTATGTSALRSNVTGAVNTATGANALRSNTTGTFNTAVGKDALLSNTNGHGNTASGFGALQGNCSSPCSGGDGTLNTASGGNALYNNTTGYSNTAVGHEALYLNTTGYYNTALGAAADVYSVNLTNATAIGYGAVVNASNKIRLGNAGVTLVETQGDFHSAGAGNGIILKSPNGEVCRRLSIDNTGALVITALPCP